MLLATTAEARDASRQTKVVVVVTNRLTLDDLTDPSLHAITKLVHNGAIGLISPNCTGSKSELSCMLTAGAGASCRGGGFLRDFYDSREMTKYGVPACDAYASQTGCKAGPGSAVFLGLGPALRTNIELAKPARLGILGDALHVSGRKTCVSGNSDIHPGQIDRSAAALAMDSRGQIDFGRLSHSSSCDADFTVIDFGSTTRLDDLKDRMTDKAFALQKSRVMQDLDKLVDRLMADDVNLVLVSFSLPTGKPWDRLTPIVIYAPQYKGALTSPTTRTIGLIAASDFAPTILNMFSLTAPPEMLGRAASAIPCANKLDLVRDLDMRVHTHQIIVAPVIYVIMTIGALTYISAILLLAFSIRARRRVYTLVRIGLVTGCASSLAMLLAVFAPADIASQLTAICIFWCLIVAASFGVGHALRRAFGLRAAPMLAMFTLGSVGIIVDAVTGGGLCRYALPSQYQLSGFRYYGIGNEYAGLLISMSALVVIFSGQRLRRYLAPIVGILVIFVMGMGRAGANYGATITASVVFGLICTAVMKGRFGLRHVVSAFTGGVAILAILAVVDYHVAGSTAAHAGRMANLVQRIGGDYVFSLIVRKVMLNLRIIVRPEAMIAYAVLIPTYLLWVYRVPSRFKEAFMSDKPTTASLKGLLIGMLVALIFNDSGMVMALIMFGMFSSLVLYFMMETAAGKSEEANSA
ncbi:hypothetical protein LLG46_04105 [bacterium]|nr:hypothetical protein [bacterium]